MSCVENMQPELNFDSMYLQWQEIIRQIQNSQKNNIYNIAAGAIRMDQSDNTQITIEEEVEDQTPQSIEEDQSEQQTSTNDIRTDLDSNKPKKLLKMPIKKKNITKINKNILLKEPKQQQVPKQQQQIYSLQKKQIKKDDHNQFANILNNFINNFVSDYLKKESQCTCKEQQAIVAITNKLYSKKIFKQLLKNENENKYTKILVSQIREYFKPGGRCEQKYIMEKNSKMKNIMGCDDLIGQIQEQLGLKSY